MTGKKRGYMGRYWAPGVCDGDHDVARGDDNGGRTRLLVTRLHTGGGSNAYLCRKHLIAELQWRQDMGWHKGRKPSIQRMYPEYDPMGLGSAAKRIGGISR